MFSAGENAGEEIFRQVRIRFAGRGSFRSWRDDCPSRLKRQAVSSDRYVRDAPAVCVDYPFDRCAPLFQVPFPPDQSRGGVDEHPCFVVQLVDCLGHPPFDAVAAQRLAVFSRRVLFYRVFDVCHQLRLKRDLFRGLFFPKEHAETAGLQNVFGGSYFSGFGYRVSFPDHGAGRRDDLGEYQLGTFLELGREGGLGFGDVAGLRGVSSFKARAKFTGVLCAGLGRARVYRDSFYVHRGQFIFRFIAQLCVILKGVNIF